MRVRVPPRPPGSGEVGVPKRTSQRRGSEGLFSKKLATARSKSFEKKEPDPVEAQASFARLEWKRRASLKKKCPESALDDEDIFSRVKRKSLLRKADPVEALAKKAKSRREEKSLKIAHTWGCSSAGAPAA
ncbi:MAG: hypothetical protein PHP74_00735 [Candidatus Gracilibacteria bacterium]|nr:hypothetical protein [Candidatus Gracilibacteria bacterium]